MRTIPDPGFAGDDGSVPVEVAAALAAYHREPHAAHREALVTLQHTRVLVPVVAVPVVGGDKTTDMATVMMQGRDGRMALLAFTGNDPMSRWNPAGRPVPVTLPEAARAAVHDGADALLIDVAGPVMFAVEGEDLRALADGFTLTGLAGRHAWVRPEERGAGEQPPSMCAGGA